MIKKKKNYFMFSVYRRFYFECLIKTLNTFQTPGKITANYFRWNKRCGYFTAFIKKIDPGKSNNGIEVDISSVFSVFKLTLLGNVLELNETL